jgi:hypothetical protein
MQEYADSRFCVSEDSMKTWSGWGCLFMQQHYLNSMTRSCTDSHQAPNLDGLRSLNVPWGKIFVRIQRGVRIPIQAKDLRGCKIGAQSLSELLSIEQLMSEAHCMGLEYARIMLLLIDRTWTMKDVVPCLRLWCARDRVMHYPR